MGAADLEVAVVEQLRDGVGFVAGHRDDEAFAVGVTDEHPLGRTDQGLSIQGSQDDAVHPDGHRRIEVTEC